MSGQGNGSPGPVPRQERVQALDVARGAAVLGVLLMNIWAFAGPQAFFDYPVAIADRAGAPVATWVVIHTLFEGSQRALLSLLFGAGALLFTARQELEHPAGTARRTWYRRTLVLIAFGLVNAYLFMWPADILFVYGLAGLCLFPLRKLRTPVLLWITLAALMVPAVLRSVEISRLRELESASIQRPGSAMALEWAEELRKARPSLADEDIAPDIHTMQTGGLPEIFAHQARVSLILQTVVTVKWWFLDALAVMILGMVLCRSGILTKPTDRSRYAALSLAGFVVGLPLAIWQTSALLAADFHPVTVEITKLTSDVRRLAMAFGYLGLILFFSHSAGARPLAAAGRMALTNYLAQSILCALLFYGFGLGLYGRVTGYQLYGFVLAIWVVQLGWSSWWLNRFQIGPFEWIWRSLTYRRRQAWQSLAPAADRPER